MDFIEKKEWQQKFREEIEEVAKFYKVDFDSITPTKLLYYRRYYKLGVKVGFKKEQIDYIIKLGKMWK